MKITLLATALLLTTSTTFAATTPDDLDTMTSVIRKKPLQQEYSLKMRDLDIKGRFPANTDRPFVMNGYDNANMPYTIEITTAPTDHRGVFRISATVQRWDEKESVAIIIKEGEPGKVTMNSSDLPGRTLEFATKVVE